MTHKKSPRNRFVRTKKQAVDCAALYRIALVLDIGPSLTTSASASKNNKVKVKTPKNAENVENINKIWGEDKRKERAEKKEKAKLRSSTLLTATENDHKR